jgi:putative membrane protein
VTAQAPREPDGDERRTTLAGERTSLAGERTLLAWWRTGLAALAVALGVGRLLPVLAPEATRWPYVVLGIGFALYGIAMFLLGTWRMGALDRVAGDTGERSAADHTLLVLMGTGAILGIGTLAVIVAQ